MHLCRTEAAEATHGWHIQRTLSYENITGHSGFDFTFNLLSTFKSHWHQVTQNATTPTQFMTVSCQDIHPVICQDMYLATWGILFGRIYWLNFQWMQLRHAFNPHPVLNVHQLEVQVFRRWAETGGTGLKTHAERGRTSMIGTKISNLLIWKCKPQQHCGITIVTVYIVFFFFLPREMSSSSDELGVMQFDI